MVRLNQGSGDTGVGVVLVIECKSARDKPWVLFSGDLSQRSSRSLYSALQFTCPKGASVRLQSGLKEDDPVPLLSGCKPFGHSLVRAYGGNEDVAFGAMMSAAKAAGGVRNALDAFGLVEPSVVIPVVLIDAPLVQCTLDKAGQPALTPIDRGTVRWRYQMKTSSGIGGTDIIVVTSAALPKLVDDLITTGRSLEAGLKRTVEGKAALARSADREAMLEAAASEPDSE
ncbi:hypothetical protein [Nocardia sp. X0981]